MKNASKVMAAIAVGVAGVLALGACSSGSDQAQSDREAAPAQASPTNAATLPAPKGTMFADVTVAYSKPAKCTSKEVGDKLVVNCTGVQQNAIGDQVFIRVPNKNYRVDVQRVQAKSDEIAATTTQRDWLYFQKNQSIDDHTVWNSPYTRQDQTGVPWGVGINGSNFGQIVIEATVTKRH